MVGALNAVAKEEFLRSVRRGTPIVTEISIVGGEVMV
jgi:hypothetical protein